MINSNSSLIPIGGYFELDLPYFDVTYLRTAYRYQSARAAFCAILRSQRPKKVWVPKYICNAMLLPLKQEGIEYGWYDLDEGLNIESNLNPKENEWILYVNYFGICDRNVKRILKLFPACQIILDYSQAYFSPPIKEVLATVYSPRKFFGVPDGGLLFTDSSITLPDEHDENSIGRMLHLLKRLSEEPEVGFSDYQASETSLEICSPLKMSKLTERLLMAIDYDHNRKKRNNNFLFLHEHLKDTNLFNLGNFEHQSPLCYPYLSNNTKLRENLLSKRIFLPTYWNDAVERLDPNWGNMMVERLLPIPIDHRYGKFEMEHIVKLIFECI
ncbi:MAG: hypothetical protein KZQ75_00375 [Candidatus Thiodiazotropha sp. (ex Myrtea spinifera)]|nr:hypothetical protein [Candidatus Thiodiazotropha sp. (ex Myrtea spinifera)]